MDWNWIDAVLGALVVYSAVAGIVRGLLRTAADLLALAASFVFALAATPHGARWIEAQHGTWEGEWRVWTEPIAFVVALVVARVLLGVVFGWLLRATPKPVHGYAANRVLGVVPGAANGLIHATVASMLLVAVPWNDDFARQARESEIAGYLARPADWLEAKLGPIFHPAVEKTLTRLTVHPESRETVRLPFSLADAPERPELEARMLELVNDERRAQGLRPLATDPEATRVSRAHARDMLARGYFSHVTPEGTSPSDRWRRAELRYLTAAENLALARTLPMAHQGLMKSDGHRANILQPAFGRVGIGIVDGGRYGLAVTQTFRN